MVYKVDGNPQLNTCDWSMFSNILNNLILQGEREYWNWKQHQVLLELNRKGRDGIKMVVIEAHKNFVNAGLTKDAQ